MNQIDAQAILAVLVNKLGGEVIIEDQELVEFYHQRIIIGRSDDRMCWRVRTENYRPLDGDQGTCLAKPESKPQ